MIAKLNKVARSLQHNINEFDKTAREQARIAAQDGNFELRRDISEQRRKAVEAANHLLDLLEEQAMSTDTQKKVAAEIDKATHNARTQLRNLKKAGKILDAVTKLVPLVTNVLNTIKTVIGP